MLLLPLCSYAAIFKHAKDELGFCYYLIPCGNKAQTGQCGNCTVRLAGCCHRPAAAWQAVAGWLGCWLAQFA